MYTHPLHICWTLYNSNDDQSLSVWSVGIAHTLLIAVCSTYLHTHTHRVSGHLHSLNSEVEKRFLSLELAQVSLCLWIRTRSSADIRAKNWPPPPPRPSLPDTVHSPLTCWSRGHVTITVHTGIDTFTIHK